MTQPRDSGRATIGPERDDSASTGPGTVLLVEDDEMNLGLLEDVCTLAGWRTICARDGDEGFRAFVQEHPDLVLLDLMMAGADGFTFLEQLAALPTERRRPVVVISALSDVTSKWRASRLGASRYLTKPFSVAVLVDILKAAERGDLSYPEWIPPRRQLIREAVETLLRRRPRNSAVGLAYMRGAGQTEGGDAKQVFVRVTEFLGQPQLVFRVEGDTAVLIQGPSPDFVEDRLAELREHVSRAIRKPMAMGGVVARTPSPGEGETLESRARSAFSEALAKGIPVVWRAEN